MSPMLLCDAISAVLADALSQNHYESSDGMRQMTPKVIKTFYPPKRTTKDDDFPYLYIVPTDGEQRGEYQNTCTVQIYVGIRSESFDGFNYVFSALEVIKQAILSKPAHTISHNGMTFTLGWPFKWTYPAEQAYPLWQIGITTTWILPATLDAGYDDL